MNEKRVSVCVLKPVFSIHENIEKWQEEKWKKFGEWLEVNGAFFNKKLDRDFCTNMEKYEISFIPKE